MNWLPKIRLRVILVALTLLAIVQFVLAFSAYLRLNTQANAGFRLPLPSRTAAIVETVEAASENKVQAALDAVSSPDFIVWIGPFEVLDTNVSDFAMEDVEDAISRYVNELGDRKVEAWIAPDPNKPMGQLRFERYRMWSEHPMRLAVSLEGDEWLFIETRDNLAQKVFGFPPGIWAGLFGLIVGALSLSTLWRGLGPLEELSNRVTEFSNKPVSIFVKPKGPKETQQITEAINSMQNEIVQMLQERETMLGAMSHDLRTYITRLRLRINAVSDIESRGRMERDLADMTSIVDDALVYAKLQASKPTLERVDLTELLLRLVEDLESNSNVSFTHPLEHLFAFVDPTMLRRAVANLIINADHYAEGGTLSVLSDAEGLKITVSDSGPGVPEQDVLRLLEPFERGTESRNLDTPGSGLGLAIAKRIAEQHGGSLSLHKNTGGGLRATLMLPKI